MMGKNGRMRLEKKHLDFYATDMVSIDAKLLSYPYFSIERHFLVHVSRRAEHLAAKDHSIVLELMVTLFMMYK